MIVSYSIKHRNHQRSIRYQHVERALKALSGGAKAVDKKRQNDPRRFIRADHTTQDGEVADKTVYYIDTDAIREEGKYDGFYAVCTNMEDNPEAIVKVNRRRWEIKECFRIMRSEFDARPVYLHCQERIVAHFITSSSRRLYIVIWKRKWMGNIPTDRS